MELKIDLCSVRAHNCDYFRAEEEPRLCYLVRLTQRTVVFLSSNASRLCGNDCCFPSRPKDETVIGCGSCEYWGRATRCNVNVTPHSSRAPVARVRTMYRHDRETEQRARRKMKVLRVWPRHRRCSV